MKSDIVLYDTTLRDGSQAEGINFSASDKLHIAEKMAAFGMNYIEGGFPGSNVKDMEFFKTAQSMNWGKCKIAAFGSTRFPETKTGEDKNILSLLKAETPAVTFGKWP